MPCNQMMIMRAIIIKSGKFIKNTVKHRLYVFQGANKKKRISKICEK